MIKILLTIFNRLFNSGSSSKNEHKLVLETGSDRWHRAFIEHLAIILQPKVYVELGIRDCSVLNRVIPHVGKVIGVDIDSKAGEFMKKSKKAKFVCSSTLEFAEQLKSEPIMIDLLFIDADHNHEAVLKDFWAFFPFISPHGLILLHDTHPKDEESMSSIFCVDAYKAIKELALASDKLELMTLSLHPGLTLIRKRKTQLSWMES
jgi:cephalosporin hydroxylase